MPTFIGFMFRFFVGLKELITTLVQWIWDAFNTIIGKVFDFVFALLPDTWEEEWAYLQTKLDAVKEDLDVITYFIPVYGMAAIFLGTYVAIANIRLFRWGLALIPRAFTGVS